MRKINATDSDYLKAIYSDISQITQSIRKLTEDLAVYSDSTATTASTEERWVASWGETVTKTTAAKMLGVARSTIYELIDAGYLSIAPNGHVIVRSAAAWTNSKKSSRKPK